MTFSRGLRGKRREQQSRPQGLLEAGLIAISQPPGSPDFTVTVTSWKVIPGQNQVPNWLIILYRLLLTRANQGRALSASQRDQGRDPKEARGGGQTGERMAWRGLQGRAPRGSAQPPGPAPPPHPPPLPRFPQTHRLRNHHVCKVLMYHQLLSFGQKSPQSSHRVRSWWSPWSFHLWLSAGVRPLAHAAPQLSTGCAPPHPHAAVS